MNTTKYSNLPELPNAKYFAPREIVDCAGLKKTCFYYEDMGKDANEQQGPRWRVYFYYAPNMALLKFFSSEEGKNGFLRGLTERE